MVLLVHSLSNCAGYSVNCIAVPKGAEKCRDDGTLVEEAFPSFKGPITVHIAKWPGAEGNRFRLNHARSLDHWFEMLKCNGLVGLCAEPSDSRMALLGAEWIYQQLQKKLIMTPFSSTANLLFEGNSRQYGIFDVRGFNEAVELFFFAIASLLDKKSLAAFRHHSFAGCFDSERFCL